MVRNHRIFYGVFLSLFCANVAFIFVNSCLPAELSNRFSQIFTDMAYAFYRLFHTSGDIIGDEIAGSSGTLAYIVRKAAHFAEFFALGVWSTLLCCRFERTQARILRVLLIGIIVPLVDETIQATNNRTSSVMDVWLDFFGFALAFAIVFLILQKRAKRGMGSASLLSKK